MCLGCALLKALRLTSSEALRGLHCCTLSLGAPKAPLLKLWMVELSSTYLALTLGALFKSMVAWDVMKEPFYERLGMWKRQYIFKGGRLTLMRSTLSNLPIYFISLFSIMRKVELRLEKIQRDVL